MLPVLFNILPRYWKYRNKADHFHFSFAFSHFFHTFLLFPSPSSSPSLRCEFLNYNFTVRSFFCFWPYQSASTHGLEYCITISMQFLVCTIGIALESSTIRSNDRDYLNGGIMILELYKALDVS